MRRMNSLASSGKVRSYAAKRSSHWASACSPFSTAFHAADLGGNFEGRVVPTDIGHAAAISASPSGAPCTSWLPCLLGPHADYRFAADQGGAAGFCLCGANCGIDFGRIVTLDVADDMPAIGFETLRGVVGEPAFDVAVDRDPVVVVERDQLAQAPACRPANRLRARCLPSGNRRRGTPGEVIDDLMVRAVEFGSQDLFGKRHSDRVADALPERAGGGFDARCSPLPGGQACGCAVAGRP